MKLVIKTILVKGDVPVKNKQTGLIILINKLGLEHSLNFRGTVNKTKSITVLKEILEKALLSGIKEDRKDKSKHALFFVALVNVDNIIWQVKIVVKEDSKHHDLFKIKKV